MTHTVASENVKIRFWKEIREGYTTRKRHYHTLNHVSDMLKTAETYQDHLEDPIAIQYSIFYHDLVYSITRKDNELKSAEIAQKRMIELGIPDWRIAKTYNQIMATQHNAKPSDSDMCFLIDIDLQVLGQLPETYDVYANNIRKEYSIYPAFMYNKGRKKVLSSFLERERIYHTESFFEKFESQARQNLQRELKSL